MAQYTAPELGRRREAPDQARTRASFAGFLLLVLVVAAAMLAYHVYRDETADADANRSIIEQPVTSPQAANVTPTNLHKNHKNG
jgi:hypothetical protein